MSNNDRQPDRGGGGGSATGLRAMEDVDTIETYHPRLLIEDKRNQASNEMPLNKQPVKANRKPRWLPRMSSFSSTNQQDNKTMKKLSQKFARLSSLDSTRSSSSMEADISEVQPVGLPVSEFVQSSATSNHQQLPPLISITESIHGHSKSGSHLSPSTPSRRTLQNRQYNNYYGRNRHGLAHDDDDDDEGQDEDDDEGSEFADFNDEPILPIPYSSSSMASSRIVRQQSSNFQQQQQDQDFVMDDGQDMNSNMIRNSSMDDRTRVIGNSKININDQQLNQHRHSSSIKGSNKYSNKSTTSYLQYQNKSSNKFGKGRKGSSKSNKDKRRSKSPSSSSMSPRSGTSRHSRRGLMGLASRLKLTKRHESIAKFQLSILNYFFLPLKSVDREFQSFLPRERMTPKEFEERVKLMRKFEVLAEIEYRYASRYETYVCKHAQKEQNQVKNNYKKCIPYDYNRVVLRTIPNVAHSDYINASHVDSCLKPNAYIAAQGPNENTIEDFWRMIWEQKSFVIVMLTKVFDFIRVMCNQYWPVEQNKPERYGSLEVTLLYEEPLADFVIRTIKLTKLRSSQVEAATATAAAAAAAGNSPTTLNNQNKNDQNEDQARTNNSASSNNQQNNNDLEDDEFDEQEEEEDDDDDDDDDEFYDDTSDEELILNNNTKAAAAAAGSNQNLPFVREPKFASRRKLSRTPRGSYGSSSPRVVRLSRSENRSASQPPVGRTFDRSTLDEPTKRPENIFLHPLSEAARRGLSQSANSLASLPISPISPNQLSPSSPVPRTPSSAGIDRSSATRKAVKKKRRARLKNNRPMRTEFQVPDESQLIDADEEEEDEANIGEEGEGRASKGPAERIIYQFHYHSWASHTCPFISSLLHFRRRVRICMDEMSKSGKTGPTIVHCNDGCGRTGTYLAIDANLELAEEDNVYDVFNYTNKMRQSRKFLIENIEQYKFVYDTIEEAMFCGKTWFPVSELHKRLKHKSQRNPITKKNEYFLEYEKITRMTSKFSIGDCAGGHRVENREKNRDVSTVPPDNFRPYLTSFQSNDDTGYINAVFVDGYTRSKEYIVTEWPLHKTISDFWSLVYDHDCNSVILLANPGESSTYPSFLPSEKELRRKFGPVFSAEMVSYTHYQNIKSWIYTINKKICSLTEVIAGVKSEAKTTQVFQITCWPRGHRVPTSTKSLVDLMNMVERWRQRTAYGPVCVVSLNGKSRAGVYCAANVAIEQVVQHSEVDVFQAVKTVRRHRPQLIENMTEYKYCYDLILHYVLHYVNQVPSNN